MNVDQRVALEDDLFEQAVGNAMGEAAVFATGKVAVEVAPVGEIAAALLEALQVDDGNTHQRTRQFPRIQVVDYPADDLDTVKLITMNRARQAHYRTGLVAIDDQ